MKQFWRGLHGEDSRKGFISLMLRNIHCRVCGATNDLYPRRPVYYRPDGSITLHSICINCGVMAKIRLVNEGEQMWAVYFV